MVNSVCPDRRDRFFGSGMPDHGFRVLDCQTIIERLFEFMRELIHFAHANSYPAGCYRKLLETLGHQYDIACIERIGHDPRFPVSDNWPHLTDELIQSVERLGRPVYGVGHSLGGALTVLAALKRPELFAGVVILDSPILSGWRSRGLWLAKRLGRIERVTPAHIALGRRDQFDSVEAMHAHFARKPLFARFDPDVLDDYVRFGSEPSGDGVRLTFRPEVEHKVYCTLPHIFPRIARPLAMPAVYLAGAASDVIGPADLRFVERRFGMRVEPVPGSHLFPLELPQGTADEILRVLAAMSRQPG